MNVPLRILLIDDNPDDRVLVMRALKKEFDIEVEQIKDPEGFNKALKKGNFDIVITDYQLKWDNGIHILEKIKSRYTDCPVIMFTATGNEEIAVDAIKKGLDDYILKSPRHFIRLPVAVLAALKKVKIITEQKLAEEELRKSEEQFRLIAENTSDNIAITTFDLKAIYLYLSPSLKTLVGYDPEDLLSKSFFNFIHPEDKKVLFPLLKKYINQKINKLLTGKESTISETIEYRFINKDGEWRNFQSTVNIVEKQLISVTRDITEHRKAQDELKKYAETQKALLREVNHRVKNNLTAILGLFSIEQARTENKAYSAFINKFKGRISGLSAIHSLLSESGWLSLNITHLCEQTIKASISCIPNSNFINFNVSHSTIKINTNQAHHLTLIINELITNSLQYGQNNKHEIRINVDIKKDKENVIITYRDTGKGYPKELIERDFSNTGVGFELIKGIVTHSLNGELQIYNDNGAVTVFKFKLET